MTKSNQGEGGSERRVVEIDDTDILLALTGPQSELLKIIGREAGVDAGQRGHSILLAGPGPEVDLAERFLAETTALLRSGVEFNAGDYVRGLASLRADPSLRLRDLFNDAVVIAARNRTVVPKSVAQRRYVHAIRTNDLTFGIGPAGTGKTYLAMAMAVGALLERRVKRIVLARPAVEAGERLGFLPGDLAEKVNPYLRPLYDALHDLIDFERAQAMLSRGQIEVAPLAFMRGRTLSDSFVILDEAQNSTSEQMRMFLTRIGLGSRVVVTGDVTQVDLPPGAVSGLAEARRLLTGVEGIALCEFTEVDVVRHPLVQRIVLAYERRDSERQRDHEVRRVPAPRASGAQPPPDDHASPPDDRTTRPDDRTTRPDDRTMPSDDRTTRPDDRTTRPDDRTTRPGDATTAPGRAPSAPEPAPDAPPSRAPLEPYGSPAPATEPHAAHGTRALSPPAAPPLAPTPPPPPMSTDAPPVAHTPGPGTATLSAPEGTTPTPSSPQPEHGTAAPSPTDPPEPRRG